MYLTLQGIVRRSKWLLRLVATVRKLRRAAFFLVRARVIRNYLVSHEIRRLQIGCGPNLLEGWLNTDILPRTRTCISLDAKKSLTFKDSTFDYIFSEHQIEQLSYQDGLSMLQECYRILKPGGKVRIATPSLDTLSALITSGNSDDHHQYIRWVTDVFLPDMKVYKASIVVNTAMREWGHIFLYDLATLKSSLEDSGFTNITRYSPGISGTRELQGIENHGRAVENEEMNQFETMVLEGTRP